MLSAYVVEIEEEGTGGIAMPWAKQVTSFNDELLVACRRIMGTRLKGFWSLGRDKSRK
jgi:hypothetical protein